MYFTLVREEHHENAYHKKSLPPRRLPGRCHDE